MMNKYLRVLLGLIFMHCALGYVAGQHLDAKMVVFFKEENNVCLRCHAKHHYSFSSADSTRMIKREMCPNSVIDTVLFYESNHRSFKCTDCHDAGYGTYPHPSELKAGNMWACLDCHGGDETFAKYHFEELQAQFEQSIHFKADQEAFTCWRCHNPHTYKTMARTSDNVLRTVRYDNNICLQCHANINRMEVLTDKDKAGVIKKHDWLPNQQLHFLNVRCVECHSQVNDTLLVSHLILPKDQAVKKCAECHSRNSLLMATLYKFQVKENRQKYGFLNTVILNDSFVIGANRNYFLNVISLGVAVLALAWVIVHIILRILLKK
jgi:hypothetical protein